MIDEQFCRKKKERLIFEEKNPEKIVRQIRILEKAGYKFRYFLTLTYRDEPLREKRGLNSSTVKKIIKWLMEEKKQTVLLIVKEEGVKLRRHYHMAYDKYVDIKEIIEKWKGGYSYADVVKAHEKVKHYILKKMRRDNVNDFRLFYNLENLWEEFQDFFGNFLKA